ncbi:hypothetical protein [Streptomyces sp. NPDC048191]|uniref:hypothetical protein n=1 Tax=Streptomyces sp. NPDC048191 TaxID=3155484 RepID=UPI00340B45B2
MSGPATTGRATFVTHEDIADVITAVALEDGPHSEHDGATLEITGPEALTFDQAVTRIATTTCRHYRYEPETLEEAFAWRWQLGMSGEQIETWISWYQAIERGEVSVVTDVVPRLTASPATPISNAAWWPAPNTARGTAELRRKRGQDGALCGEAVVVRHGPAWPRQIGDGAVAVSQSELGSAARV